MNIKKQATIYSISTVIFMFAQWVISVALVRLGDFGDAGVFSLAMGMANVFGAVAYYGIRSFQVSDVTHQYSQKQYMVARVLTVGASFLVCWIYLGLSNGYTVQEKYAVFLYLTYTNACAFGDVLFGTLQMDNHLYVNGYSFIAKGILCGAGMLVVYVWTHDLLVSLGVMAAISIVVTVFYDWQAYTRVEKVTMSFSRMDARKVRDVLIEGFPLMLSLLFPNAITALPRQTINQVLGNTHLGYFSSLFTPTALITTLMPSIILTVVPKMAKGYHDKNKSAFLGVLRNCYISVFAVMLLGEVFAVVAGRPVMKLLFGEKILPYYSLFYWAIVASGLNAMGACGEYALISMHKAKVPMFVTAAALVILYFVVSPLVVWEGIMGAAVSLIIAYGVRIILQIIAIGVCMKKIS